MKVTEIYVDELLKNPPKPTKIVHKNYDYKGYKLLLCTDRLAANYAAPFRARSTRQWRYVNCKKCLKKRTSSNKLSTK